MKQLLQNLKTGELELEDVPSPSVQPGHLLIRTTNSLISAGTERMLTDFARAGYLAKAKQQPDKVKQVFDKIKTDGVAATYESVKSKLEQPIPMGYCNVGRVIAVGQGVTTYKIGDRVVSNGNHAEVVHVPKNLCAPIPSSVTDEQAVFTVLGAIGLQGVRLCQPTLGESVAVFGLGLIGLLAAQLLNASGCRVIGFDFACDRVELARGFGIEAVDLSSGADPVQAAEVFTNKQGIDAVVITAATQSDELIHQAAEMCRKRARIVLTGVIGLNLRRADFYEKEISFQVSCSYGPGRYDPAYEDHGNDYPVGFVRWTEQRNFQAILAALDSGRLNTNHLISERFRFDEIESAYEKLNDRQCIGVLLQYENDATDQELLTRTVPVRNATLLKKGTQAEAAQVVRIGVIGAGQFAQLKILPGLQRAGASLKTIASAGGISGSIAGKKFGFHASTTDYREILSDDEIDAVVITTRHSSHAKFVIEALDADKDVFVEKPLCMIPEDLERIESAFEQSEARRGQQPIVMLGFNRRFAPATQALVKALAARQNPGSATFTCNAGEIPSAHWVHDPLSGGGRVIGEACHFIDYLSYLFDSPVTRVAAFKQRLSAEVDLEDNVTISLSFADGSIGNVNYFSTGSKSFPKERCEVYFDQSVALLDNFRSATGYGMHAFKTSKLFAKLDKGHGHQFECFVNAVRQQQPSPIPLASTLNVMRATFAAVESMRSHSVINLG